MGDFQDAIDDLESRGYKVKVATCAKDGGEWPSPKRVG